ncbi:hypothetical protein JOC77_002315 [Peribacillus deserti]|uniref:Uncharacterized protein n=1 Tax=Peribacillus deserti TaxID=673318 RepID=A0ABS2QJH7_9BACI|nr:hypothetical protein [Peribacillus deserti]MBM7692884.1 hypothetical protein [Peribacillus deserti]
MSRDTIQQSFIFEEDGIRQVTDQITDAYESGYHSKETQREDGFEI